MSGSYYLTGAGLNPNYQSYGQYGNYWGAYYGVLSPYGTLRLTESSPAQSFVEPCTLSEMKSYLRIPDRSPTDTEEDDYITSMIIASREFFEIKQGRDLIKKQWDLALDYWNSYRIELRDPLQSVDSVQYTDCDGKTVVMDPDTDYAVDTMKQPGILSPPYNGTWPTFTSQPSSSIRIRFTSGYPQNSAWWNSSGHRVKMGMKMLMSHWYNNRMVLEKGLDINAEYPYSITACAEYGSLVRAR